MGTLFVIIVVALVAWAIFTATLNSEARKQSALALATIPNFEPAVTYEGVGAGHYGLAIDPASQQFAVSLGAEGVRVFSFTSLVAVEVERDGQSITQTNRGSQAVGAAVGAVLLGPVGLLMGGVTGSKRTVEKIRRLSLKLYTNDLVRPVYEVAFLNESSGVSPDGILARTAATVLDEWYGRFRTVLHMQRVPEKVLVSNRPSRRSPNQERSK